MCECVCGCMLKGSVLAALSTAPIPGRMGSGIIFHTVQIEAASLVVWPIIIVFYLDLQ